LVAAPAPAGPHALGIGGRKRVVECFLIRQQYQEPTGLMPLTGLKSPEQRRIGFGKCQQGTLADVIGQLIYPLEIIQNTACGTNDLAELKRLQAPRGTDLEMLCFSNRTSGGLMR
jgi:hypothetical protein